MRQFRDRLHRSWDVTVNVTVVRRVRDLLQIDLLALGEFDRQCIKTLSDPVNLCNVLYVVCRDEAERREVSDVEFGRTMSGDSLEQAFNVLMEELVDFFPHAKRRMALRCLLRADSETTERVLEQLATAAETAERASQRTAGRSWIGALVSWAWTPARTLCGNCMRWRGGESARNGTRQRKS